ncbi:DUF4097 and DUF4098 domain-containing protein YvlB [Pullulanibacillus pueri]|uniref:DUF4097 domain-containing protein n=1 Tax=Pullulanibacillus pueri TaxID=1437324 RepID=A0A8J3A000_9BACL|nr:DUF4097 family beta strand repeat-containing protein [Pullulanibacillus pueri]MBM7683440.1 DUF4097 and DUF4098 domain-containing protein YvlB [Pullulanibacillus pueri]GGH87408.1 hypothetical protein GCM10007096_37360 [Pullulanibacillus pueri]
MGLSRVIVTLVRSCVSMFKVIDVHESIHIPMKIIKNIDILASSHDIFLEPIESEDMLVELQGRATKNVATAWSIQHQVSHQSLNVSLKREKNSSSTLGFSMFNVRLKVGIPRQYYDSLKVKTSSGGIHLNDIAANAIYLTASSGSIVSKNSVSGTIYSIETSSGSIRSFNNQAQAFEIRANSGSVKIEDQVADQSTLRTSSGSIVARNLQGDVTATASSGSIRCDDIELSGDWRLKTSSGSMTMHLIQPVSLELIFKGGSGSGSVGLRGMTFTEKSAHRITGQLGAGEYKIEARANSGSFKITE